VVRHGYGILEIEIVPGTLFQEKRFAPEFCCIVSISTGREDSICSSNHGALLLEFSAQLLLRCSMPSKRDPSQVRTSLLDWT